MDEVIDEVIDWDGAYSAAMDSVNLLKTGKPEGADDEDWVDCVKRNVDHLKIILEKDWPKGFDLEPFKSAIG